jgi:hypothetical protein
MMWHLLFVGIVVTGLLLLDFPLRSVLTHRLGTVRGRRDPLYVLLEGFG